MAVKDGWRGRHLGAGIRDINIFLPRHRVCMGGFREDGEKRILRPVAHYDEDALTMGFAALSGLGPGGDSASLYFTASRYPYDGIRNADLLACTAGMNPEAIANDTGTSLGGRLMLCTPPYGTSSAAGRQRPE